MSEDRPIVIYPEYFDFNLKRSQGRKVSSNISVKKPNIDEIVIVAKTLGFNIKKRSKSHPSNWHSELGSLTIFYEGTKVSLLRKMGKELKLLRKTD